MSEAEEYRKRKIRVSEALYEFRGVIVVKSRVPNAPIRERYLVIDAEGKHVSSHSTWVEARSKAKELAEGIPDITPGEAALKVAGWVEYLVRANGKRWLETVTAPSGVSESEAHFEVADKSGRTYEIVVYLTGK